MKQNCFNFKKTHSFHLHLKIDCLKNFIVIHIKLLLFSASAHIQIVFFDSVVKTLRNLPSNAL